MNRKYYGRFTDFTELDMEACAFEDSMFWQEGNCANSKKLEDERFWTEFKDLIQEGIERSRKEGGVGAEVVGNELIYWANHQDAFAVTLILVLHWDYCMEAFFPVYIPDKIQDLISQLLLSGNSYDMIRKCQNPQKETDHPQDCGELI